MIKKLAVLKSRYIKINAKTFAAAILLCLFVLNNGSVSAFEYRLTLDGVLDNYQYRVFEDDGFPKTFRDRTNFFTRVQPEVGVPIEGSHKIRSGFTYLQDFGAEAKSENLHLLLYYHYDDERLQFRFGSFPRADALDIPEWFFSREFAYYRPFVHGAAGEIRIDENITFSAWADWLIRPSTIVYNGVDSHYGDITTIDRHQTIFGARLGLSRGIFFARCDFMMRHYHDTYFWNYNFDGEFIRNNAGISAEMGAAWGQTALSDTLMVSGGPIMGLERVIRGSHIWQKGDVLYTPAGGFVSAFAASRILGMRGFMYTGEPLRMPHGRDQWAWRWQFNEDGGRYRDSWLETYGRLDLMARLVKKENIRAEFTQAFHLHYTHNNPVKELNGISPLGFSQHFLLHAEFGGSSKKYEIKPEEKKKRRGFGINVFWE
ncbi:MAG: hypothetical protein FWE57_10915 [Chitinispirillia bacterium]|nr:hypothetical protein [Chitinispirillia bacterium]